MPDLTGQTLGRYRLDARLGAGGMGVVYRAHDTLLERDVALKILSAGSEDASRRLLLEARNASALNHPNICTIHEVGRHDDEPFIVMEYVEGRTLDALIPEGGLPASTIAAYAAQIADALTHAHGRGVIHRDLKCANVAVTTDGIVKVLDFGIATRLVAADQETREVDSTGTPGVVTGTVAYMAPEVLRDEPADPRSEIWALGVMLYEMATGRSPFTGVSSFGLVSSILQDHPKPLPASAPPALQVIIDRCLAKDRTARYQHARELKAALDTLRDPAGVRPPTGTVRPSAAQAMVRRRIESLAVLPLANRCPDPAQQFFVDGMTDALIAELARLQALRVISRTSVMRYRDTVKAIPDIAAELGVDAVIEGSVMSVSGTVRVQVQLVDASTDRSLWSHTYDRAAADILALHTDVARAVATEIRVRLSPSEQARLAEVRPVNAEAHARWLKGRYHLNKTVWTPADYEQALEHFRAAAEIDPGFAPAYVGQADIYHRFGGYGFWRPKDAFPLARTAALRAVELDDALPDAHAAVAFSRFLFDWDWPGAEAAYLRALELGSQDAIHQYGALLTIKRRHDEAIARYLQAETVNPFSSDVHWGLGMTYRQGGWHDRAVEALRSWLAVEPHDVQAMFQLALTLADQAQYDEASALLTGMAAIPALKTLALGPLAYVQGLAGRTEHARRSLAELEALAGMVRVAPGWMAYAHMGLGDHDRALDALEQAVEYHDTWNLVYLHVERPWDPLRRHPRFQAVLRAAHHAD